MTPKYTLAGEFRFLGHFQNKVQFPAMSHVPTKLLESGLETPGGLRVGKVGLLRVSSKVTLCWIKHANQQHSCASEQWSCGNFRSKHAQASSSACDQDT
jgi:hypothetical protein